ncbi:MAG: tryptophan 2,3-dioxygenase family protein [Pseudomonadota bacterium]
MSGQGTSAGIEPGVKTDLAGRLDYASYLDLDRLLSCQKPATARDDELLFIVIHQATELWLKVMVHELHVARTTLAADTLRPSFKMLARVSRVQAQLIQSWDVLSTLTPADYLAFRDRLGPASGLQSHQYRVLECLLGYKRPELLAVFRHIPEVHAELDRELGAPSLYDEAIRVLARRGLAIAPEVVERDWRQRYQAHDSVRAAWARIYREPDQHWELYELAEKLIDLEDWSRQWRFRHLTTVERIIGRKTGTGGSSGVDYLARGVSVTYFPELWQLRTEL